MRPWLAQITDVRQGEGASVLKTTAILFSVIAAHTLMETARDAMFLEELPPRRLAVVYAVLAVLAVGAARLSTRVTFRFGRRSSLLFTLLVAAHGASVFYLLPKTHPVVFGLYVFSGLVSGIAVVQFWMLASHWFTVAQGRRLFGLISVGGVVGAIAGASAAIGLLRIVVVEHLLIVAAALYLLAAGFAATVQNDDEPLKVLRRTQERHSTRHALRFFRDQPYVTRLALLLMVSTSALLTTDYLFKSAAARAFEPRQLGEFFATYYAGLNALALLVQVVLSGYVVQRLGVLSAFLVLPVLLLGGGAAIIGLGGVLALVLVTKAFDGGLRHSLHRVTSELLWMPLPEGVRTTSKAFIDTVVVRMAQAIVAGVLFLLGTRGWDNPRTLAFILCGLLLAWVALGIGLRTPYLNLFRQALTSRRKGDAGTLDLNTVEVVVEALSSRESTKVIAAMEVLANNNRARLIPALILYHESEEVLIAALGTIATAERKDWLPLARRLLSHASVGVRVAAMRALAAVGDSAAAEERLYDVRPEVRGHAAFLVDRHQDRDDPRQHAAIRDVLELSGAAGVAAKCALLASIRNSGDERYAEMLLDLAADPSEEVVEAALLAMTTIRDARFVPFLIDRLAVRHGRDSVREALVAHGELALNRLESLLRDPTTDPRVRRHIPTTLAYFGSQRAADVLAHELSSESVGHVRYKILKALGRLATESRIVIDSEPIEEQLEAALDEHLRMKIFALRIREHAWGESTHGSPEDSASGAMLLELLDEKAAQAIDRAFRLLHILHRGEDMRSIAAAAQSADKRVRAQAMEYVDTLTLDASRERTRKLFSLVLDDLPLVDSARRLAGELGALPSTGTEALLMLAEAEDETLAAISAYCMFELGDAEFATGISQAVRRSRAPLLDRELIDLLTAGARPASAT